MAQRKASRLSIPGSGVAPGGTSVSDYKDYRDIVEAASKSHEKFSSFRRHPSYSPILEHVSRQLGQSYLEIVQNRSNLPKNWLNSVRAVNVLGNPPRFYYSGAGRLSPTLLRYLKVYSDLLSLFGPLDKMTCVEVGVGFGGQSVLLNRLGGVQDFHLFDLPPVLELTRKFTSLAGCTGDFQFHDGTNITHGPQSDILISNYAFSELTRALQERYLDQVIARSERGYITWNPLSPDGFQPRDLVKLIPGSKILPERPLTYRDNCIIVWGSEEKLTQ